MQPESLNRHTEATRRAIVEAGAALLLEGSDDGFTVQGVADRAGLTHRTVYRYFPTRQELLAAAARSLALEVDDDFRDVSTIREWLDGVGPHLAGAETNLSLVRRLLAAVLASEDPLAEDPLLDRDARRWEVLRAELPHLTESDARRTFAMLRHLTSSSSYVLFRLRFGMAPPEAVETIRAAALLIVDQAAARDRAAARGLPGDG
jgi:AcrR family transcriptional regulator